MVEERLEEKNRKGISTFIATLLLMVLAVAAGIVIYAYTMGYLGGFGGTNTLGALSLDSASAGAGTGTCIAYIRNIGKTDVTVTTSYVNNQQTTLSANTPIVQNAVVAVTINEGTGASAFVQGQTYTIKLICSDNTQISFDVKAGP